LFSIHSINCSASFFFNLTDTVFPCACPFIVWTMKSLRISLAFASSSTATHEPFCYATCQNETNQTKFIKRIRLDDTLERYLNTANTRKVSPSKSIGVLLRNIILHRTPIYDLQDWASRYRPTLFGLDSEQITSLKDDRIGRDLDMLLDVERASILTEVVVRAIKDWTYPGSIMIPPP
jgi:hypothetical protein